MAIASTAGHATTLTAAATSVALPAFALTAGQDLVIGVAIAVPSVTVTGVTDTMGNVFRFRIGFGTSVRVEIWEAQSILSSTTSTATVHLSGSAVASAVAWEYAGVKVEVIPSPQDMTSSELTSSHIQCGVATSDISSWATCFFGFISTNSSSGLGVVRGNLRLLAVPATAGVGIALFDVAGYPSPSGANPFEIAGPLGNLVQGVDPVVQPWAAVAVELRSASGPGGVGSEIPPSPPWVPPPAGGTLVAWSYTYIVPAVGTFKPGTAEVTCHFLGGGCPPPAGGPNSQGNQAY